MHNDFGTPAHRAMSSGKGSKATLKDVSLRRILLLFMGYRALLLVILVFALTGAVIGLIPPLLMKEIIDTAIPNRDSSLLILLVLLMTGLPLLSGIIGVWQNHLNTKVAQGVMRDLRVSLFRNLQRQSMSFFTASRSGEVIQRLTEDVSAVQNVVTSLVVSTLTQIVIVFTSIGILFALDWKLAILSIIILPLFVWPVRKVSAIRKRMRIETQKVRAQMSSHLGEVFGVSGAMLTRIFAREVSQERKFAGMNQQVMDLEVKLNLVGRWFGMFISVLGPLGTAIIYLYGGYEVIHGDMKVGSIVAFAAYLSRLYSPVGILLNLQVEVGTALGVFQRIFEYQDMKPDVQDVIDAKPMPNIHGSVVFKEVSFAYGAEAGKSQNALKEVSFEARLGEAVALVGPSGAGKSTLIGMIARLYDPTSGAVEIDGIDIKQAQLQTVRSQVAYVTQESFLFHASIRDNLLFAKEEAAQEELEQACRQAYIHDLIASLPDGYETIVGERGHRLSGGERQRVAIARAILNNPRILILDEATSHLDSESESSVQAALEELMRERTTIVIAHRLSTILAANQILVLDAGRIVEHGKHAELLSLDGLYARLYHTQFDKAKEPAV